MLKGRLATSLAASQYRNTNEELENIIGKLTSTSADNKLSTAKLKNIVKMIREESAVKLTAVTVTTYDYDKSANDLAELYMENNLLESVLLTDDLFEDLLEHYSEKNVYQIFKDMIAYGYIPKDIVTHRDNVVAYPANIGIMFEIGLCGLKSIANRLDAAKEMDMSTFAISVSEFITKTVPEDKMEIVEDIFARVSLCKPSNSKNTIPVFALDALCSVIYKRVNR